jgi:serine protease Do
VRRASRISVKLHDGRVLEATVVGADPSTDLALVKVNASGLPYLKLADSTKVDVGDWVLAFGSPFGLEKTMTAGIISAKGRVIGAGPYDQFIQTDAAINPGNSGGPLVNLQGEVVGINTMIASGTGGFQGVGFAIPSSMASGIYKQLASDGRVTRGWLGVRIREITPEIERRFDLSRSSGVMLVAVDPRGPAARAGLRSGDVVTTINGREITAAHELSLAVAEARPGVPLQVGIWRDGRNLAVQVRPGVRPDDDVSE